MRRLLILPLIGVSAAVLAQNDVNGDMQFPQFRSLSGLPGGGFGLRRSGMPGIDGALALSSPIAYSMGGGRFAFVIANTSYRGRFDFFDSVGENAGNGTAAGMMGVRTPFGNLTIGGMILSSIGDNVLNLHFAPDVQGKVAVGFGVQDAFSTGGTSGEMRDLARGGGNSRSFYAVATAELAPGAHVSGGIGTQRFKRPFGNASVNLTSQIKAMAEYDSFNWNYGVAAEITSFLAADREVKTTLFVGQVRGKYLTWSIGFSF